MADVELISSDLGAKTSDGRFVLRRAQRNGRWYVHALTEPDSAKLLTARAGGPYRTRAQALNALRDTIYR